MNKYVLVNADTDSIAFCKPDGAPFTEEERQAILDQINAATDELIVWEDDGLYEQLLVVKAKNYAWRQGGKLKLKGSALLANYKEPALKAFLEGAIRDIMAGASPLPRYEALVRDIHTDNIKIEEWSSKKTITDKVLNPKRTNEQKVLDALLEADETPGLGDKVWVYFREDDSLGLVKFWKGDHSKPRLYEKLYKTVKVLETILDLNDFKNYKLKKNKLNAEDEEISGNVLWVSRKDGNAVLVDKEGNEYYCTEKIEHLVPRAIVRFHSYRLAPDNILCAHKLSQY